MAFTITGYNFAKRANSTKQPTGLSGTDFSVVLKDKCSYDKPVFRLQNSGTLDINYIQWGSWYYFVTDISYVRDDLFDVTCDLDVLATYKTEIGQTSAFVLYDTAANTEIVDGRLSMKSSTVTAMNMTESEIFDGGVSVVVGITGKEDSGLFAMEVSTARSLLRSIDHWMDEADSIPWPIDEDPDDEGDGSESDSDPGSNSDDPGHGPGTIYG